MIRLPKKELDELVATGVIDEVTAKRIEEHYEAKRKAAPNKLAIVLWCVGAVLIGTGIVLLIAHNWDELGKATKTLLAFIPLLIAQALCFYVIKKRMVPSALAEIGSILLFFAVATNISLVSQIYNISGTMADFLRTWTLLTIPLVYVLRSQVVAILVLCLATWQACLVGYGTSYNTPDTFPWLYVFSLIVLLPNYYWQLKSPNTSISLHFQNWLLPLSLVIVLGAFEVNNSAPYELYFVAYLALFVMLYLIGRSPFYTRHQLRLNPFLILGLAGILVILLAWSYDLLWEDRVWDIATLNLTRFVLFWVSILMAGVIAGFIVKTPENRKNSHVLIIASSLLVFIVTLVFFRNASTIGLLIINLWVLAFSISFIRRGAASDDLGTLNFGILIIAVLAILRFFDDKIPFVVRGSFFLLTGIAFFAANYFMLQKRKQKKTLEL